MSKDEINLMLSSLIANKKAFKKFLYIVNIVSEFMV